MLDSEIVKMLRDTVLDGIDRERYVGGVEYRLYSCTAAEWNRRFNEGIDAADRVIRTAFESVLVALKNKDQSSS